MKVFIYNDYTFPSYRSASHTNKKEICLFQSRTKLKLYWRKVNQPFIAQQDIEQVLRKNNIITNHIYTTFNFVRFAITDEFQIFLKLKQNDSEFYEFEI